MVHRDHGCDVPRPPPTFLCRMKKQKFWLNWNADHIAASLPPSFPPSQEILLRALITVHGAKSETLAASLPQSPTISSWKWSRVLRAGRTRAPRASASRRTTSSARSRTTVTLIPAWAPIQARYFTVCFLCFCVSGFVWLLERCFGIGNELKSSIQSAVDYYFVWIRGFSVFEFSGCDELMVSFAVRSLWL